MPQDRPTAQWSVVDISQEVIPMMKRPAPLPAECERSERPSSAFPGHDLYERRTICTFSGSGCSIFRWAGNFPAGVLCRNPYELYE